MCTLQALNKREKVGGGEGIITPPWTDDRSIALKALWIDHFQEGIHNHESIQLKDMLG